MTFFIDLLERAKEFAGPGVLGGLAGGALAVINAAEGISFRVGLVRIISGMLLGVFLGVPIGEWLAGKMGGDEDNTIAMCAALCAMIGYQQVMEILEKMKGWIGAPRK